MIYKLPLVCMGRERGESRGSPDPSTPQSTCPRTPGRIHAAGIIVDSKNPKRSTMGLGGVEILEQQQRQPHFQQSGEKRTPHLTRTGSDLELERLSSLFVELQRGRRPLSSHLHLRRHNAMRSVWCTKGGKEEVFCHR